MIDLGGTCAHTRFRDAARFSCAADFGGAVEIQRAVDFRRRVAVRLIRSDVGASLAGLQVKCDTRRACEPRDQGGGFGGFDLVLAALRAAHRQCRLRRRQFIEQRMKFQLAQQLAHRALVDSRPIEIVQLRRDRRGGIDTDELARKLGARRDAPPAARRFFSHRGDPGSFRPARGWRRACQGNRSA